MWNPTQQKYQPGKLVVWFYNGPILNPEPTRSLIVGFYDMPGGFDVYLCNYSRVISWLSA